MNGLKAPNIIPPWATSLLGGARKEGTTPPQQPAFRNNSPRPSNDRRSPGTSAKEDAMTTVVDRKDASVSADGGDDVHDDGANDDAHPSQLLNSEPLRIASHIILPSSDSGHGGKEQTPLPLRVQRESMEAKPKKKRRPGKKKSISSSRMKELQKAWNRHLRKKAAAASGELDQYSSSPFSSDSDASIDSQKPHLGVNHIAGAAPEVASSSKRKRSLPGAEPRLPGFKRRQIEFVNDGGNSQQITSTRTSRQLRTAENATVTDTNGAAELPTPASVISRHISEIADSKASGSDSRPTIIKINRKKPLLSSSEDELVDGGHIQKGFYDWSGSIEGEITADMTTRLNQSDLQANMQEDGNPDQDPNPETVKPEHNMTHTAAGRIYTEWPLPDGTSQSHNGGLCPTNYRLWTNPIFPYICPVRDCRSLSASVATISAHMTGKHWGGMYNDNSDGTISFLKFYRNKEGSSPPIVVTRNPLRPDALPPAAPFVNERTKKRTAEQMQRLKAIENNPGLSLGKVPRIIPTKPKPAPTGSASRTMTAVSAPGRGGEFITKESPKNEELYAYLVELLPPGTPIRRKQHVAEYIQFPKLRELPAWWSITSKSVESTSTIASILLYLTGCLAPDSCSACLGTQDLCILPPSNASAALKQEVKGCGGCWGRSNVFHQRNACSFLMKKGTRHSQVAPRDSEASPELGGRRSEGRRIVSESAGESEPVSEAESDTCMPDIQPSQPPAARISAYRSLGQQQRLDKRRNTLESEQKALQPDLAVSSANAMSADMIEMEDWEVAPGRIRDETGPAPENVAFSNSYLTTNQTIPISPDVSFNVVVLKPGGTTHWAALEGQLRVCSVAAGKVRVKLDDTEFVLGPNGMFKIRAGAKCSATNRLYLDAVLHISTIAEF